MGESELIGRRREMAYLRGWLTAAVEGELRLVLCGGEPGIGKTRLASALAEVASAGLGAQVAWARASEDRGAPPYWLWRQALPSCEVLSAPDVDGGELGRAGGRFPLFDAVTRQLLAAAADDPVLLVLDDVHWADQPSLLLLRHLARELRQVRLLVMAAYRTTRTDTAAGWPAVLADLGVFKAAGMTPRQTITMVICWVIAPAVIATAIALPAGLTTQDHLLRQLTSGTALHGTALPGSFVHVLGGTDLLLLALGGLAIAIAGALGPASWAARTRTSAVLHTE